jgi:hypothetical protein
VVTALASDPNHTGVAYAATSVGIYKTGDFGASWTAIKTRGMGDPDHDDARQGTQEIEQKGALNIVG